MTWNDFKPLLDKICILDVLNLVMKALTCLLTDFSKLLGPSELLKLENWLSFLMWEYGIVGYFVISSPSR